MTKDGKFEHTAFDEILFLFRALASIDDRIIEYFRAKSNNKRPIDNIVDFDIDEKFALKIDTDEFIKSIETKCWESISKLSWRQFEEARAFVHSLNLKSIAEWRKYCEAYDLSSDIPVRPDYVYRDSGWKSWGDWLGTGFVAYRLREHRPFEEARAFVHKLNLKNTGEWNQYCRSGDKPDDIPTNPGRTYKDSGWKNWWDWLGNIIPSLREYKSFEEARAFVLSLNLKNAGEWRKYCKSGKKPNDIPPLPQNKYKNSGWKGMGDWLGTGNIQPQLMEFRSFNEARAFVQKLNLKSMAEWKQYCKSGQRPDDIPANPNQQYQGKGWKNMGDWLGAGSTSPWLGGFRPFEDARAFVHTLNQKDTKEWNEYCKTGNKPDDIPADPLRVYKNAGWTGWGDWLGKE